MGRGGEARVAWRGALNPTHPVPAAPPPPPIKPTLVCNPVQAVHVFRPAAAGAALSTWLPPGGGLVSLAALQGQYLALACGSAVQVLYCGGTGRLQEECQVALPQQASALALFELGGGSQASGRRRWYVPCLPGRAACTTVRCAWNRYATPHARLLCAGGRRGGVAGGRAVGEQRGAAAAAVG